MADRRAIIEAFCEECVWARAVRTHFADLFEANEERSQLQSEVANIFFHDLNLILIEYILLQQCKLTDPASSGKDKDNLTTNFILELPWSPETKRILKEANDELMQFREKIIDGRRKAIAHADLRSRVELIRMGEFSPDDEAKFWSALQTFVDAAHSEAIGGPYEINAAMVDGDVASLVHALKDAVDYEYLVHNEEGFLLRRVGWSQQRRRRCWTP
ncbi:MAG TPA: hypothetical protein VJ805_02115 [Nitrospiraceae bacterium]|nr:hypothetical protein [Nitrospiraceae bacterium]